MIPSRSAPSAPTWFDAFGTTLAHRSAAGRVTIPGVRELLATPRVTSGIDFLVRFAPGRSLFDQAGLIHDLEELLGMDDVISEGGLRPTDSALQDDAIAL